MYQINSENRYNWFDSKENLQLFLFNDNKKKRDGAEE